MDYKVLSRKYRPQNFNEIIGQSHVVDTLNNSISSNRLAHGYLLTGVRGVGKTTTARVLSKTLNCLQNKSTIPCEKCQNCIEITESRSLDVIELDGASNRGIDEIREIKETVKYPPISSKYKVFIIDEVHMLTKEAFNALLKTLEEPPKNVIFILATTDSHKIPDTILSRTLRFDFKRITNKDLIKHMIEILEKENIKYEENALNAIAFKADGSVRDSLSILDRIISYSNNFVSYDFVKDSLGIIEDKIYLDLLDSIINSDQLSVLTKIKYIIDSGYSIDNFISGFNTFLSNCLVCISGYKKKDYINEETLDWIKKKDKLISSIDIMRIIEEVQKYELMSKNLLQPAIALESLFLKLSVMGNSVNISEVINSIDTATQEKKVSINIKNENKNNNDESHIKTNDNKDVSINISKDDDKIIKNIVNEKLPSNYDKKDFKVHWNKIIELIDLKDKRISNALEDANAFIDKDIVIIDLGIIDNEFIKKTLYDNKKFIQECINEITNHKFNIEIKVEIKLEEEEKDHPLLNDIKSKFNSENNV
tara:strand:- start:8128 stop:9741 length:1614 start_codon:yes stop_codon:yes gene_type:complete